MSVRSRLAALALLALVVAVGGVLLSGGLDNVANGPGPTTLPSGLPGASGMGATAEPTIEPTPTPRPATGDTELYGFLPYWQMNATMATYLRSTPLTTLALFSVSARNNGGLAKGTTGYRRITGPIGRQLIDGAHARNARVDLTFTSFGDDRNAILFGRVVPAPAIPSPSPGASAATALPVPTLELPPTPGPTATIAPWHRTVDELVALALDLGVDGICVDVERLDDVDRPAYAEFLLELRAALVAAKPKARLTVATEAGMRGTANAAAAFASGADRLFLMGYDYHWSGSQPGASAPIDRDDGLYTLRWSIDSYVNAGVPRDRILLGLPLYGMKWRVQSATRTALVIGEGVVWVPSLHRQMLLDPSFAPIRDDLENAEVLWETDGAEWLVTYYDSPATLRPKLALALDNGLAGGGFWAMGYERGLPGYIDLMTAFRDGAITRGEAPPRP